jgi:hypothetical protein
MNVTLHCDWDEFVTKQYQCPGGEFLYLPCSGIEKSRNFTCGFKHESECVIWTNGTWDGSYCRVAGLETTRTRCLCSAVPSMHASEPGSGVFMDTALIPAEAYMQRFMTMGVTPIMSPYAMIRTLIGYIAMGEYGC